MEIPGYSTPAKRVIVGRKKVDPNPDKQRHTYAHVQIRHKMKKNRPKGHLDAQH